MSYKKPDTGDLLNDYFSQLTDFVSISPNLLNATSEQEFEVWLEKLELIDRRALFLFIQQNIKMLPVEYIQIAQRRFIKEFSYD